MKRKSKLMMIAIIVIVIAEFGTTSGQVTLNSNNQTGGLPNPAQYVGSANGYNVEFKAGTAALYMKLLTNGNLGLSNPTNWAGGFVPNYSLDIDAGDINLNTFTNAFRIGSGASSYPVLWHNGDITSIFVGVGAGISTTPSSTLSNTLVGNAAGSSLTTGKSSGIYKYTLITTGKIFDTKQMVKQN